MIVCVCWIIKAPCDAIRSKHVLIAVFQCVGLLTVFAKLNLRLVILQHFTPVLLMDPRQLLKSQRISLQYKNVHDVIFDDEDLAQAFTVTVAIGHVEI